MERDQVQLDKSGLHLSTRHGTGASNDSTGQPLNVLPDDVAEQTARGWEPCRSMAFSHFEQLKRKLDIVDPGCAT